MTKFGTVFLLSAFLLLSAIQVCAQFETTSQDESRIENLLIRLRRKVSKDDNAEPAAIDSLEKAAATATQPARSILQNLTATAYWQYLHHNRQQVYGRSHNNAVDKTDMPTWSFSDFREKITSLYLESLREQQLLQNIKLEKYGSLLI